LKLYNRYLASKVVGYFLVIATILICLVWFSKAVTFIKFITEKGIKLSDFLYLFVLVLPWLMMLIIPISLFIAVLISYGRMNISNEITILKNSGINKFLLAKPIIWTGFFCSLFCYLIALYLMPLSNKELRLAKNNFQNNYENIVISPGIFETLNNLTIYVKDRNYENELFGVLIYDRRNSEYALTISARYGKLDKSKTILLHLSEGTVQKYNFISRKSEILKFDQYVVNLSDTEQKSTDFRWKAGERYIWELLNPEEGSSESDIREYRAEIHKRLTYPLFSLILSLVAAAFILKGQFNRRSNIGNELQAVVTGVLFIISVMTIYDMIEKNSKLIILLYVDLLIFTIFSISLLKTKKVG
jgi:lipopolysaccharide export system permease protein